MKTKMVYLPAITLLISGLFFPVFADPINDAARKGDLAGVQQLLNANANIETRDNEENTPLICATQYGHLDVVKLLLERGAQIEAVDEEERTPLMMAVKYGHIEIVMLFLDHGAKLETKAYSNATALLFACGAYDYSGWDDKPEGKVRSNKIKILEMLLMRGANINVKDKYGKTPLGVALDSEESEIARILRKHGAKN